MASDSQMLIDALVNAEYRTFAYSGRGMFGKECVAVSIDSSNIANAMWNLAMQVGQDFEWIEPPKWDQLGNGLVLYWPMYEWPSTEPKP